MLNGPHAQPINIQSRFLPVGPLPIGAVVDVAEGPIWWSGPTRDRLDVSKRRGRAILPDGDWAFWRLATKLDETIFNGPH